MNDYLDSIKNIEEQGTNTDFLGEEINAIPIIENDSVISGITSSGIENAIIIEKDDLSPYMKPQKVTVRKYRLKK